MSSGINMQKRASREKEGGRGNQGEQRAGLDYKSLSVSIARVAEMVYYSSRDIINFC